MKRPSKRSTCIAVALAAIVLLLLCEIACPSCLFGDEINDSVAQSIDMIATRFLGGVAFLAMLINLGYRVLNPIKKPFFASLLFALPALVIAVNNFPFSQVIKGETRLESEWWAVALLFLECMCVGFFEETAFRGVVFLTILKRNPESRIWAFASIAISSVAFGLVHLLNLFESSPVAVLMQIGYSALIGAMCAVLLMRTANIWISVVTHGLFNFAGAIIPRCGVGEIWDSFTVILTVILSVLVAVWFVLVFIKGKFPATQKIFEK